MATVYLGRARGLAGFEREVAVKLTHEHLRHTPGFVTALMAEARFANRIRHTNVVSVLDVGQDENGVFIVMDYVEGDSLAGLVRTLSDAQQRVPWPIALRLLEDVLTGLHAAHEVSGPDGALLHLVHRDVSPHNILIGLDGVSRLTDFGIAKASRAGGETRTGLIKGKIAYMSPEQARAEPIDRRCDVWAAGIVAWELFSGRRVHEGLGDAALLLKVAREAPTPLGHVEPDLPTEIADVVDHALRPRAQDRFATAEAFADALAAAAQSAGLSIASHRDTRAYVLPYFQSQVDQRRSKIAELDGFDPSQARTLARSQEGAASSRSSYPPPGSSPSWDSASGRQPMGAPLARGAATVTETVGDPASSNSDSGATVWNGPLSEAPEHTATYGQGVEVSGQRPSVAGAIPDPTRRARSRRMLFAFVLAPLVLLVLLWAVSASRHTETTELVGAAPLRPPAPTRPPPVEPTATQTLPPAVAEIPVFEPSALPLIPSTTPPAPRRVVRPVPRAAPPAPKPEPLDNPY